MQIKDKYNATGMKTIGEVRATSDDNLLYLQAIGPGSIAYLREAPGPSLDRRGDAWAKSPHDLLI
jgi:hypothetical protein